MTFWQWLAPWDPSLGAAVAIGCAAIAYFRGCRSVSVPRWQRTCFWTGLFSFYITLLTHFDYYAEHEFFMGRIQQGVLQHFAPFLVALSAPSAALRAGVSPLSFRKTPAFPGLLSRPVVAVVLFNGVMLFWLVPGIHFIAMLDWRLYRVMNWSMAVNGLMFWSVVLDPRSKYTAGSRIAMMLAVIPAQIAVGALLSFAPRDLYPIYSICGRALDGLTPLQDQQVGGVIIWIHGAMMSILGVLVVAWREIGKTAASTPPCAPPCV
jgi:putative membrane protein